MGLKDKLCALIDFFYFDALNSGKRQNHKNMKQNDNIISGSEFQAIIHDTDSP